MALLGICRVATVSLGLMYFLSRRFPVAQTKKRYIGMCHGSLRGGHKLLCRLMSHIGHDFSIPRALCMVFRHGILKSAANIAGCFGVEWAGREHCGSVPLLTCLGSWGALRAARGGAAFLSVLAGSLRLWKRRWRRRALAVRLMVLC